MSAKGIARRPSPPTSPSLPLELLREVLARCDLETLVRCAASSRLLCRCMTDDPAFLRQQQHTAFAPSLLLGLFHYSPRRGGTCFIEAPGPAIVPREPIHAFLKNSATLLRSFDVPGTCRDGLVVFRQGSRSTNCKTVELCVCDPMTGRHCILPAPGAYVRDHSLALLVGDNASASTPFQMLAVNLSFHVPTVIVQLFSSPESFPAIMPGGAWGPIRRVAVQGLNLVVHPTQSPVVIDRVAHWLSQPLSASSCAVLALHIDAGRMELIEGPWRPRSQSKPNSVILASTAHRRLSLVAVEELVISMWVLSQDNPGSWEQNVVVVREGIIAPPNWIRLDWFGERSGAVVMSMTGSPCLLVLNLETKEVAHMPAENGLSRPSYLYEMDLPSLVTALDGIHSNSA